ncbi:MAG: hypothetical protein QOH83_1253 [Solirubrobacteraceae bacterium]|nr:hypothetical protein [Solirubrobacteraceae bacterium]
MARSLSARSGSTGELQTFEEGKQGVGRPVAAGAAVGGRDAVERALFEREVGVQVDVGGAFLAGRAGNRRLLRRACSRSGSRQRPGTRQCSQRRTVDPSHRSRCSTGSCGAAPERSRSTARRPRAGRSRRCGAADASRRAARPRDRTRHAAPTRSPSPTTLRRARTCARTPHDTHRRDADHARTRPWPVRRRRGAGADRSEHPCHGSSAPRRANRRRRASARRSRTRAAPDARATSRSRNHADRPRHAGRSC